MAKQSRKSPTPRRPVDPLLSAGASALVALRWARATKAEKLAHSEKMNAAKAAKKRKT